MADGFWRVYRDEWSVIYVSDTDGESGYAECVHRREAVLLSGVVVAENLRVMAWSETDPGRWPWMLEVRLPVIKAEFRGRGDAARLAGEIEGVVLREGSQEDKQALRRYQELTSPRTK